MCQTLINQTCQNLPNHTCQILPNQTCQTLSNQTCQILSNQTCQTIYQNLSDCILSNLNNTHPRCNFWLNCASPHVLPEEDTEGQSDSLYDDPGEESIELELVRGGRHLGQDKLGANPVVLHPVRD